MAGIEFEVGKAIAEKSIEELPTVTTEKKIGLFKPKVEVHSEPMYADAPLSQKISAYAVCSCCGKKIKLKETEVHSTLYAEYSGLKTYLAKTGRGIGFYVDMGGNLRIDNPSEVKSFYKALHDEGMDYSLQADFKIERAEVRSTLKENGWHVVRAIGTMNGSMEYHGGLRNGFFNITPVGMSEESRNTVQQYRAQGIPDAGFWAGGYQTSYGEGHIDQSTATDEVFCDDCWENEDLYFANGARIQKD